jgi:hypothetical protein
MRDGHRVSHHHTRNSGVSVVLALTLLAIGVVACTPDTKNPTDPNIADLGARASANGWDNNAIIVSNSAELVAALVPENAGRHIRVRAGDYSVSQPLTVPDRVTMEGEGVMLFDGAGLPTGFTVGTRTTLTVTTSTAGNVLTLGNGVTLGGIAIDDMPGRIGNAIGVVSRDAGDQVSANIDEIEIINPNGHTIVPSGPSGCGITVLTLNPNLGADPPPHTGAAITARVTRSLIHSLSTGTGCALFAFNFAPLGSLSVVLEGNVLGGGIIASGGVSRPDAVHDSKTTIQSQRNLYRNDSPDHCAPQRLGWNVQGAAGAPVPLVIGETARNALSIHSLDDRIEGFTTGIFAAGGRRFFALPTAGPTTDNSADLELISTTVATPSCGGASFVTDFRLAGAIVASASLVPGDGNTLRAVMRGVTGSGLRSNFYADVLGPAGPVIPATGTGNRIEFAGSLQAFTKTNRAIDPAPAPELFSNQDE